MSAETVAVPAADVQKLIRAAKDDRYRVAILLASFGPVIKELMGHEDIDSDDALHGQPDRAFGQQAASETAISGTDDVW